MSSDAGPRARTVEISRDGFRLKVGGDRPGELRPALRQLGLKARVDVDEGGLVFDLDDAPILLTSDLQLTWEPRARSAAHKRAQISRSLGQVRQSVAEARSAGVSAARERITDCSIGQFLDDHQALNVACLTVPGSWGGCIFDEQGTGKTVTLMATFDVLVERRLTETLLIVAPKTMVGEWEREFRRFFGDVYKVAVAAGRKTERAAAFASGADVIVTNYETLVSFEREVLRLAERTKLSLAVDESFNLKNPLAIRTASAFRVRETCTHAFVLCGTPAPNSASDVISQFDLTDLGATFRGVVLDKDAEVARAQVRTVLDEKGVYVRNLKSIVLPELPPRTFNEIEVELTGQQRLAYESALDSLVADLRNTDDSSFARQLTSFLEKRSALLRICADPTPLIPGYSETPAKILALDRLLSEILTQPAEKVVIWSFYRACLERISERYQDYGLVRVDGSVTDASERKDAVTQFQQNPMIRIFVGNPAAAGAGLTLHAARYSIYESLSNQAAHYLQSLDRVHRRGQERDVEYFTLLGAGTIEEREYERLQAKAREQSDLLGDPVQEPSTRKVMLEEMLRLQAMRRVK